MIADSLSQLRIRSPQHHHPRFSAEAHTKAPFQFQVSAPTDLECSFLLLTVALGRVGISSAPINRTAHPGETDRSTIAGTSTTTFTRSRFHDVQVNVNLFNVAETVVLYCSLDAKLPSAWPAKRLGTRGALACARLPEIPFRAPPRSPFRASVRKSLPVAGTIRVSSWGFRDEDCKPDQLERHSKRRPLPSHGVGQYGPAGQDRRPST